MAEPAKHVELSQGIDLDGATTRDQIMAKLTGLDFKKGYNASKTRIQKLAELWSFIEQEGDKNQRLQLIAASIVLAINFGSAKYAGKLGLASGPNAQFTTNVWRFLGADVLIQTGQHILVAIKEIDIGYMKIPEKSKGFAEPYLYSDLEEKVYGNAVMCLIWKFGSIYAKKAKKSDELIQKLLEDLYRDYSVWQKAMPNLRNIEIGLALIKDFKSYIKSAFDVQAQTQQYEIENAPGKNKVAQLIQP